MFCHTHNELTLVHPCDVHVGGIDYMVQDVVQLALNSTEQRYCFPVTLRGDMVMERNENVSISLEPIAFQQFVVESACLILIQDRTGTKTPQLYFVSKNLPTLHRLANSSLRPPVTPSECLISLCSFRTGH